MCYSNKKLMELIYMSETLGKIAFWVIISLPTIVFLLVIVIFLLLKILNNIKK